MTLVTWHSHCNWLMRTTLNEPRSLKPWLRCIRRPDNRTKSQSGLREKGEEIMLNRANGRQQLNFVNKLIRAISDEMPKQSAPGDDASSVNRLPDEMKEALQQLRLKKLLISAIVDSDRVAHRATRH